VTTPTGDQYTSDPPPLHEPHIPEPNPSTVDDNTDNKTDDDTEDGTGDNPRADTAMAGPAEDNAVPDHHGPGDNRSDPHTGEPPF
jgi:hypothetical protein